MVFGLIKAGCVHGCYKDLIKSGIGLKNYEDFDAIVIMINLAMDLREYFPVEKLDVIWLIYLMRIIYSFFEQITGVCWK